jgi:hypothetical protein
MKKSKSIIAVLMVFVIIASFVACSSKNTEEPTTEVTQAVTDSSGEVVTSDNGEVVTESVQGEAVTDSKGEVVTEVVTAKNGTAVTNASGKTVTQVVVTPVTQANGTTTTKKSETTKASEKETTTKSSKDKTTTKATVTKPAKPANISSLKASSVDDTSVKLSWSSVDCKGYQIAVSYDGGFNWTTLESSYTKGTTYTVKNLTSMTEYNFRVRAYNQNSAGKSTSDWKTLSVTTSESDTSKYLTIYVILPKDNSTEDTLTISIDGKVVHTADVKLNGSKYEYKTDKKYKGAVDIVATLTNNKSSQTIRSDKNVTIDLSNQGIDIMEAEND